RRALELVHHLALADGDLADDDWEAELGRHDLDLDLADADLAGERMVAGIAALRRIGEGEEIAFIAAREVLQPQRAVSGEGQGLAGEIARLRLVRWVGFDQPLVIEEIADARRRGRIGTGVRLWRGRRRPALRFGREGKVEQAVRVVEGRAEELAARHILE